MIHYLDFTDFEPSISNFYSSVAVLGRKKWNSMTHLSVCSHWLSFSQTKAFKCIVGSKPARSVDSRTRFLRVAAPQESDETTSLPTPAPDEAALTLCTAAAAQDSAVAIQATEIGTLLLMAPSLGYAFGL